MSYFSKVVVCFSFTSVFLSSIVRAESLIELYEKAKVNSPDFQIKNYAFQAIQSKEVKTKAAYFPTVDFDANYTRTWQDVRRSDSGVFPKNKADYPSNNITLSLKQKIFDGSLLSQLSKSKYEVRQSQFQLRSSEQDLMYQVADRYFSTLASQDQLALSQAEAKAIRSEYELTQVKYKQGIVNILEWQEIQSRNAEAEANVSEAKMGLYDAQYALKQLTGEMPQTLDKLFDGFNEEVVAVKDSKGVLTEALNNNFNLQAQREAVIVANEEVSVQRNSNYPTVDFSLVSSYDDAEGSLYGGGNRINDVKAKIALNMPIYRGGFTSAAIDEARHQKSIQQSLLTQTELQVETDLKSALNGIESSLVKIRAMKTSVEANTLVLAAKRSGLKSGLFTSLDVLDAESKLYYAKKQLSASLYQLILHYLKFQQVTGRLDQAELINIGHWLTKS